MLEEWLEYVQREDTSFRFKVNNINEKKNRDTDKINQIFGSIILDNIVGYDTAKKISESMGWNKTVEKLVSPRIPKTNNMKKGKFGEILESKILEEFFDFVIPIKKWKYAITSDQSLPSTDIVAIKKNDSGVTEISFIESKLTTDNGTGPILKAYEQLVQDRDKGFSEILNFITCRLLDEKSSLAEMFIEYGFKKDIQNDTYRIAVTCDTDKWNDRSLKLNTILKPMSDLTIDVIRIKTLETIVNGVYEKKGWNVIE